MSRFKLFQSLKLLINPGATDRALEKFKRNLARKCSRRHHVTFNSVTRSYCLRDNLCLPCQAQEAHTQRHTSFLHQPRIKLFQSLNLLINPRATDRALEKFKRNLTQVFPQTSCSIYLLTRSYCLRNNLCLPCQAQEANIQFLASFLRQPRFKLFQSLKLLINPGATDRALEKFKRNLAQVFPQTSCNIYSVN